MPDCAAVRITATLPEELADQAEAILEELSDVANEGGWDWHITESGGDGEKYADGLTLVWEDYDCPWGLNTPREAGVLDELRSRGIAYEAVDFGHYTWDGETEVWRPSMAEPYTATSGVEGTPVVTMQTLATIADRARTGAEFRREVLGFITPFLDDPADSVEATA